MLSPMFDCPHCGRISVLKTDVVEIIDTDRDDVWEERVCETCGCEVREAKENGVPVMEEIDDDRLLPKDVEEEGVTEWFDDEEDW